MSVFTPPTVKDVPAFLPDSTPEQKELWRHYENRMRGVNVWLLSDGNVVHHRHGYARRNKNTDMSRYTPGTRTIRRGPYVRAIYIDVNANPQICV